MSSDVRLGTKKFGEGERCLFDNFFLVALSTISFAMKCVKCLCSLKFPEFYGRFISIIK